MASWQRYSRLAISGRNYYQINMSLSRKTFIRLLWSLNVLLVLLMVIPVTGLPPIFQFVGRLHPLMLHFPIGLLVVALLFEFLNQKGQKHFKASADLTLWLGAFTATFAAIAGLLLSIGGGYGGNNFDFHKWFGLATSLIAAILIQLQSGKQKGILSLYTILVILLVITGHFGASLTHGEDFLTEVFEDTGSMTLDTEAPVFSQVIMPVVEAKCISCHNPNKVKGGLLMDTEANLMKGGETGSIIVPGDLANSKFISHTLLPTEDKLHMPPKGKVQLTNEEIKMLSWWVENGASFDSKVNEISADDPIQIVFASYFTEDEIDIDFVEPEILASLNANGINVKQIAEDKPFLSVYLGQRKELSRDELKALRKVEDQIFTLDLGGSYIDKSIMKEVARYENLHRLYLDNTMVDDGMLSPITDIEYLQYLNLYGSQVTEKGVDRLLKLPSLEQLYIWQTQVEQEQLAILQKDNPSIEINGGLPIGSDFATAKLVAPKVDFTSSFFDKQTLVDVSYNLSDTKLFYQFDDTAPQLITDGQVAITESGKLTVYAQKEGWEDSPIVEQVFIKVTENSIKQSKLKYGPKGSYTGNGVSTLFDLNKGSENFRDGQWLGFAGDDLIVDVELNQSREISSVFVSTLDDIGQWIFPPTQVEVWGGNDPNSLTKLQELSLRKPEESEPQHMIIHELAFETTKLKHIRVRVKNYGDLPEWHQGKGTPAWLFIDEVAFN